MNRVAPSAVTRQMIANLENHKRLTQNEQATVLHALQKTGITVDRILANLSRQTLTELLKAI